MQNSLMPLIKSIPRSYAQVFFSDSVAFGLLLMVTSFFDVVAGFCGLLSIVTSVVVAHWLGFSQLHIRKGIYGYNSLLVGLGIGLYFMAGWQLIPIVVAASILSLFLTLAFEGIVYKHNLPFLSIPFMLGIWIVMLSAREFSALGVSERGIYVANDLYLIGGYKLVKLFNSIQQLELPLGMRTYLLSLGAIFFQTNIFAGILIAIGLVCFSRIAFVLSIVGFTAAWVFYGITGANLLELSYTFIGFNYILTAIAIGGMFIIPSLQSFLWTILLLPVVVLITLGSENIFFSWQLSIYSLPFNVVVLSFLYVLRLRLTPSEDLALVYNQKNSPERNLYSYLNSFDRFPSYTYFPVLLPFFGEWTVSQGNDGEYTHKGEWKYAWDFVITDKEGKQYSNKGDYVSDYYCYGKAVCAPADGTIADLIDGVPDNLIGDVDTLHNWGNTIVIKHTEYLYSKLSHLQPGSLKVKKGEFVKAGQAIGLCGNSGRSPYPHLHLQFQAYPTIGAQTLKYFFAQYIENSNRLFSFASPRQGEKVTNIQTTPLLSDAFHFIPGQSFRLKVVKNEIPRLSKIPVSETVTVESDEYNQTFIVGETARTTVYNDNKVHYFNQFMGKKDSLLFILYNALLKVQLGFYKNLSLNDRLPVNLGFDGFQLYLQDLIAPFYRYLDAEYQLNYTEMEGGFSPSAIILDSSIRKRVLGKIIRETKFRILVSPSGIQEIMVTENEKKLIIACLNESST